MRGTSSLHLLNSFCFLSRITLDIFIKKMTRKIILVSANEYAKFSHFKNSFEESISVTTCAESTKTCLFSSSNKWVIDSCSTNHMTCNYNMFSIFRSHEAHSLVTVVDGSTCNIVGSRNIKPTSTITLSSVLSLPKLAFYLIFVSRITRDLNCYISFFADHFLFCDFTTNNW